MTICEVCGRSVDRRSRLEDGRLVCWDCKDVFMLGPEQICEKIKAYREFRDRAWAELDKVKSMVSFGSPYSVVPHKYYLKNAMKILSESKSYQPFYDYLSGMYKIDAPYSYAQPNEVPPNAIACYIPQKKAIVSREKTMTHHTAFHELFHHLEHMGVARMELNQDEREKNANLFAEACLKSV